MINIGQLHPIKEKIDTTEPNPIEHKPAQKESKNQHLQIKAEVQREHKI